MSLKKSISSGPVDMTVSINLCKMHKHSHTHKKKASWSPYTQECLTNFKQ